MSEEKKAPAKKGPGRPKNKPSSTTESATIADLKESVAQLKAENAALNEASTRNADVVTIPVRELVARPVMPEGMDREKWDPAKYCIENSIKPTRAYDVFGVSKSGPVKVLDVVAYDESDAICQVIAMKSLRAYTYKFNVVESAVV